MFPSIVEFLATLERPPTRSAYTADLRHFEAFCATRRLLPSAAALAELEAFVAWRLDSGDAPATAARRLAAVQAYLRFLSIRLEPVPWRPPRPSQGAAPGLGLADLAAVATAPVPAADRLLALVLAATALALDPLCTRRFDNVERGADAGAILVGPTWRVPLPGRFEELAVEAWERRGAGEYLFGHRAHRAPTRQTVGNRLRRLGVAAGVGPLTARQLQRAARPLAQLALETDRVGDPRRWSTGPPARHPIHALDRCLGATLRGAPAEG
jgi:hypothetical protein